MSDEIQAAHEALLQIHAIDQEMDALKAEASRAPREIQEEHEAIAALQELRDAAAATLAQSEATLRESERELEKLEKRKTRAEGRLPSLGTMGQIEATQREIAALTAEGGDLETTILEQMEQVEEQTDDLAAQEERLATARSLVAEHEAAWAERKPPLKARYDALTADREGPVSVLRPDVLRRYQLGRNQTTWRERSGITWTFRDRVCITCRTQVSARWLQECREHRSYHACDSCKRMLVPMPVDEPEPEEEDEA